MALNEEEAFTVQVVDAEGKPKNDLSTEQRRRGGILDHYEGGKWKSLYRLLSQRMNFPPQAKQLPDLGPGQYFFTFHISPAKAGGLFLAEPICLGDADNRLPVHTLSRGTRRDQLFFEAAGTVVPLPVRASADYHYVQVAAPQPDPDRTPAPSPRNRYFRSYLRGLVGHRLPDLARWTTALLDRLAASGRYELTPADLAAPPLSLGGSRMQLPAAADKIAHALTNYLANSGEYVYTLELRREDPAVDPAVDFLCNLKEGHCERFATGLALMLRTQGIPARLVKGFHGLELTGDGQYLVRQRHAHSWVEALVPRAGGGRELDWLLLDPSPAFEVPVLKGPSTFTLLLERLRGGENLSREFVDFGPDNQLEVLLQLASGPGLLALLVFAVYYGLRRRRRARSLRTMAALPCYGQLVKLLRKHGGPEPLPAQTPANTPSSPPPFCAARPRPRSRTYQAIPPDCSTACASRAKCLIPQRRWR